MYVLYITNSLILLRSVFRVIEYAMGNNGYLLRHEVFLYIFDAVPMLAVMVFYVWKYPSEITELLRAEKQRPSRMEMGRLYEEPTQQPK